MDDLSAIIALLISVGALMGAVAKLNPRTRRLKRMADLSAALGQLPAESEEKLRTNLRKSVENAAKGVVEDARELEWRERMVRLGLQAVAIALTVLVVGLFLGIAVPSIGGSYPLALGIALVSVVVLGVFVAVVFSVHLKKCPPATPTPTP